MSTLIPMAPAKLPSGERSETALTATVIWRRSLVMCDISTSRMALLLRRPTRAWRPRV